MMKKKILSGLTAVLCCASAVSVPASLTSAAETENRDKVYESSLILDEKIVETMHSLESCISDNQLIAYTALRDKSIVEVYCDSEEVISIVKAYAAENGLDESIIKYYVHPYDEWELDGGDLQEETDENPLVLNEVVAHTLITLDRYLWDNQIKAFTVLRDKKVIEVYCHSQEIADHIKSIVYNSGLDGSIVEYYIKPMGELNFDDNGDGIPVTNDELELLVNTAIKLNNHLNEIGYLEECAYASLRWGKHSVWLIVQSETIAEELSAYITENEISANLVDIIVSPEYDYRIADGGQKEDNEVNIIVANEYLSLKEFLKNNEILSNIYLTARQNDSSQVIYNSFVEIQVKSQEDSDAIKKYMLDNYFWDAVIDVTVTQDLSADTENFVYSKDYVCLNGDANDDGKFGISDVVTLQKYILNANSMYERQGIASDMTHDGSVDVFDLCLMKQRLIK